MEFFDYSCFVNSLALKSYLQKRNLSRYMDNSVELNYHLNSFREFKELFNRYSIPPGNMNSPHEITDAQTAWMQRDDVPENIALMFFIFKRT